MWDGIISDVTEQKLAERQVVLLNLDLERRVDERMARPPEPRHHLHLPTVHRARPATADDMSIDEVNRRLAEEAKARKEAHQQERVL